MAFGIFETFGLGIFLGVLILAEKHGVYEGLFILDANRLARDRDGLPREIDGLIKAAGGKIEVSRLWEERRLAYPIKGQRKGAYWITYFNLPTSRLVELTRGCELQEGILRQLFFRLPDALVQPILDHAKGINEAAPESAEAEGKEVAVEEVAAS